MSCIIDMRAMDGRTADRMDDPETLCFHRLLNRQRRHTDIFRVIISSTCSEGYDPVIPVYSRAPGRK